tara:strand:- start:895 stop:2592 length:1698 start_codon:yes stop_codon:yes gene_type:complete
MRYLIPLLFPLTLFAESQTTGNLITNGTFENGNANSWTQIGNGTVISDCCGSSYDYEFGNSGSIEQSFDLTSNTITQPMLNNGITLNSSIQVQNGECSVSGCWGGSGGADSFTIRLQIRDSDSNVLATTTQERTNVTGINGKDFEDSISYTGTGSNIGNLLVSGSDANAPATLGGPNLDNISVTMTYDDEVLSATQTAIIATAFEEIEETLTNEIETVEFIPLEEFVFEVFEEPEMVVQLFEELYFEEIAVEEINTGIVNIFFEPVETMEVLYEEPTALETFTTEIEIEEGIIETAEVGQTIEETFESSTTIEPNNTREEVVEAEPTEEVGRTANGNSPRENERGTNGESVAEISSSEEEPVRENNNVPEESEGENTVATEEVEDEAISNEEEERTEVATSSEQESEGAGETSDSGSGDEGTEVADSGEESIESRSESVEEGRNEEDTRVSTQTISIENIEKRVNQAIKRVDQRLIATSLIVAKAMNNNKILDSYNNINQDIFNNQPIIDGGDYYETREYIDTRNIYAENQNNYSDPVATYQRSLQESIDNTIRAEEHLRRIRGF